MKVQEVMSRDVQIVSPSMPVAEAALMMRDGDFGVLPVGENDRLVGIITDRDIAVRAVAEGREAKSTSVGEVMSQDVSWIYEDEDAETAAQRMEERQVRRLPVISREKRLVGIVSLGDFAVERSASGAAAKALSGVSHGAEKHHR